MDALERDDIERSRRTPPEVKLAQALEAGMRLQRANLFRRWLQVPSPMSDVFSERAWSSRS
jgi:hypothetical protein